MKTRFLRRKMMAKKSRYRGYVKAMLQIEMRKKKAATKQSVLSKLKGARVK